MATEPSKTTAKRLFIMAVSAALLICIVCDPAMAVGTKKIRFADGDWDSIQVQNRIAGLIIQYGLGFVPEYIPCTGLEPINQVCDGRVDIDMESWTENDQDQYNKCVNSYSIVDLGASLSDNWQGWVVPSYIIHGDASRGINPVAPDLQTVFDMARYWKLFTTPNSPEQGLFYGGVPGWQTSGINSEKLDAYGLTKVYDMFLPDTEEDMAASLASAFKEGKPWFGYYWAPSWVLGKYEMIRLKEPAFDQEIWGATKGCSFPFSHINILVNMGLLRQAPHVVAILMRYEATSDSISKTLAYMHDNGVGPDVGAAWFLKNFESLWTTWVPPQVAAKIKTALK